MAPPKIHLDIEAISGIFGSISIACWIVVFSPQILENFRRSSADGLSLLFVVVWLLGDVFNILGAVLQGVIPTMTILAVYYTVADVVLLGQCLWYRGLRKEREENGNKTSGQAREDGEHNETTPLLDSDGERTQETRKRTGSRTLFPIAEDATHLSPATPFVSDIEPVNSSPSKSTRSRSTLSAVLYNTAAITVVCLAGVLGWYLTTRSVQSPSDPSGGQAGHHHHNEGGHHHHKGNESSTRASSDSVTFDLWGQIFGYLCAILYLASRVPQLLLNYRRKSTEGVSMLFFLFACVGNLTYVLSIFAFEPGCAREAGIAPMTISRDGCAPGQWSEEYWRYILVNASWLAGSAGTLVLDMGIFAQFWLYRDREENHEAVVDE
ncbi:hypothetical protein MMC25_006871 [Agyrium rufum]|nr:hypothetical protein [Agyrium rufum]